MFHAKPRGREGDKVGGHLSLVVAAAQLSHGSRSLIPRSWVAVPVPPRRTVPASRPAPPPVWVSARPAVSAPR